MLAWPGGFIKPLLSVRRGLKGVRILHTHSHTLTHTPYDRLALSFVGEGCLRFLCFLSVKGLLGIPQSVV